MLATGAMDLFVVLWVAQHFPTSFFAQRLSVTPAVGTNLVLQQFVHLPASLSNRKEAFLRVLGRALLHTYYAQI